MRLDKLSLERVIEMATEIEDHYKSVKLIANSRLIGKATEHRLYWLSLALLDVIDQLDHSPVENKTYEPETL